MALHEQFADDLTLYALNALAAADRLAIEKHLEECSACRAEVERLRDDFALLALSASGPTPPPRCRERLVDAIRKEPRHMATLPRRFRSGRLNALAWAAAAAAIIVIVLLARQNQHLQAQLANLEARSAAAQQQLLQARELAALLSSGSAEHFTLVANNAVPQPGGKAIYDRATGTLVFLASN